MNVVIVGNGILGLTAAYKLIKKERNINITLIGPYDNKGCARPVKRDRIRCWQKT
jgi:protoporphyrinogen oxidase